METLTAIVVVAAFYAVLILLAIWFMKFCHECDEDLKNITQIPRSAGRKWWAPRSE